MISEKVMGGIGSGRQSGEGCTEDCRTIDVRQWQRQGLLVVGNCINCSWSRRGEDRGVISVIIETGQVWLMYNSKKPGGDWEALDYRVKLQTTPCHYGGVRYWFSCPAINCGKRVAKLYLGSKHFACRHCYRLAYSSQRETKDDRLIRKADKLREKLDWEPSILNGCGWKPKGMHWKTFWRLKAEHDQYAKTGMAGKMAILNRRSRKNR